MGVPPSVVPLARRKGIGPVNQRRLSIACSKCGNTTKFYGTAHTNPVIEIQLEDAVVGRYDVVQMMYKADNTVDETIEACALCGSREVVVKELGKL